MKSFQVFYRAAVMVGTLVVGALAYKAYGPELEKLEPMVTRLKELAVETLASENSPEDSSASELAMPPAEFLAPASPLADMLTPPPLADNNVQPAANWTDEPLVDVREPEPGESPVAAVVRQLNRHGVTEYSLSQWGESNQFYRFRCSAPWGTAGRYARHFEAVADDPAKAAHEVLEQIEQWRSGVARHNRL